MKKKNGISLISLIITIIVIIILAAIVIFSGLNTPDGASFAGFIQQVDNVYQAVMNKYGDLKAKHAIAGEYRTDEQIYIEIAVAEDPDQYATMGTTSVTNFKSGTEIKASTGIQNIQVGAATDKEHSIGMTLPKIRESNNAWYVTKEGKVFNANGYIYDGKTYFSGSLYQGNELPSNETSNSNRAYYIYKAIKQDVNVVTNAPQIGSGDAIAESNNGGNEMPEPIMYTVYTVGEEVTVEGEKFFVIANSNESEKTVKLLAKYCLNKAGTAQQNATWNTTGRAFSSTNYWSGDFTSSPFDLQSSDMKAKAEADSTWDVSGTTVKNAIVTAQDYGVAKGGTGRLMTYSEVAALGCTAGYDSCPDWISGKGDSYSGAEATASGYLYWWLGAADRTDYVWRVFGLQNRLVGIGNDDYSNVGCSVRPVIEVDKTKVS